jgi:23S rRNA (guanosine2251-2'-O)-methyltransferase
MYSRSKNPSPRNSKQNPKPEVRKARTISGTHAIREFLSVARGSLSSASILYLVQDWERSQDLKDLAELANRADRGLRLEVKTQNKGHLDKLHPGHQGAIIQTDHVPQFELSKILQAEKGTLLFLDGLEDPHNFGAILRTAWLMGVDGILSTSQRSVGLTPTVHKVACGGVEHVPVLFQSQVGSLFSELKENGYWIYGLSHKAAGNLLKWQAASKVVWCFGSEESGLRTSTERLCDELLRLPQRNSGASYNVSVAAAMTLAIQMVKATALK